MKRRSDRLRQLAFALALVPFGAGADPLPRVVSINVCTDQLAMLLADPAQVLSLSLLARDPSASSMADTARGFAINSGLAEDIVVQQPDLVLAHQFSDPALVALLRGVGIEVVQIPNVTSLDMIAPQLRRVGAVLGRADTAEVMATEVETALAALAPAEDTAPVAAFFYPNGYALGAGTLSHEILTAAGAQNLSVRLGLSGGGHVSLEEIVLSQPDFLVTADSFRGFSRSEEIMAHPALAGLPMVLSSPDWTCGTPAALEAIADVKAQIDAVTARPDAD